MCFLQILFLLQLSFSFLFFHPITVLVLSPEQKCNSEYDSEHVCQFVHMSHVTESMAFLCFWNFGDGHEPPGLIYTSDLFIAHTTQQGFIFLRLFHVGFSRLI